MAWQVMEYMDNNPQASARDVLGYFANQLEIDNQIHYVQVEVDKVLEIREQLRPLYGKKANTETNMALLNSDFEMEVAIKYPKGKGTDKDRKALKLQLQKENADYAELNQIVSTIKEEIDQLESEIDEIETRAKNGRRILETFTQYMSFIMGSVVAAPSLVAATSEAKNQDIF